MVEKLRVIKPTGLPQAFTLHRLTVSHLDRPDNRPINMLTVSPNTASLQQVITKDKPARKLDLLHGSKMQMMW